MVKVVSSADIEHVCKVLHPEDSVEDTELERQLVDDPDIHLNRFFHKGTSNTTEMRRQFVKKRKDGGREEFHVDSKELNGLMQLLDVSPLTTQSTAEERAIVTDLRRNVEEDLIREHHEKELMMVRKAGFWRWASKKAYKRLVQHGKIWSEKDADGYGAKNDDTASSSSAVGGAEEESTEPDLEDNVPSEENLSEVLSEFKLDTAPVKTQTPRKLKAENIGWTTVGKPGRAKTPTANFKLVHNKGLTKIANSPKPTDQGLYSRMLGRDNEA